MTDLPVEYPYGVPRGVLVLLSKSGTMLLAAGPEGWPGVSGRVDGGWYLERAWTFDDVRDALDVLGELGQPQSAGEHAIDKEGAILPIEATVAEAGDSVNHQAGASESRRPWREAPISRAPIDWDNYRL